jgi:hypothetical protein
VRNHIFAQTPVIEVSDAVKVRAAQRAIDKRAPFHRQRNGIDDAILIETYADEIAANATVRIPVKLSSRSRDVVHPSERSDAGVAT